MRLIIFCVSLWSIIISADINKLNTKSRLLNLDINSSKRSLRIIGIDDRLQDLFGSESVTTTMGVMIGGGRYCTATLISKQVIITSAHCFYDRINHQDRATNFYFYPNVISSDDVNENNEYNVVEWDYSDDYVNALIDIPQIFGPETPYDIAVARLDTSIKGDFENYMKFGYDETLTAPQTFETAGYPSDKIWGTRWHQTCQYDIITNEVFESIESFGGTCDQMSGQSGSSIYKSDDNGDYIIYAVMKGGGYSTNPNYGNWNVATTIDKPIFDSICAFIARGEGELSGCEFDSQGIKQHT